MRVLPSTSRPLFALTFLAATLALAACGGGGGGGNTVPLSNTAAAPTDQGATSSVYLSSYQNQLDAGTQSGLPADIGNRTVRTYASFVSPKGTIDAFVAIPKYNGTTDDPSLAQPAEYRFYKKDAGGDFVQIPSANVLDSASVAGCTDPNRAMVTDFNQDNIPDVFVVCTGNPKTNAGEFNQMLLSDKATGKFKVIKVSSGNNSTDLGDAYISNHASAATADLNGDGYPDVVVVNQDPSPIVLLNDKQGNLRRESGNRMPNPQRENYFSVNLLDVDGDGKLDLVLGGSETGTDPVNTSVYLNRGGNDFNGATAYTVPKATSARGYIMDTMATGSAATGSRTLWVLRRDPKESGNAATGRDIQKIDVAALKAGTAGYVAAYTDTSSVAGHLLIGDKTGSAWVQTDSPADNAALKADADLQIAP